MQPHHALLALPCGSTRHAHSRTPPLCAADAETEVGGMAIPHRRLRANVRGIRFRLLRRTRGRMVALQIRPPFDACCSRLPWGRCPPLPLVVLPLIASALLRYARSPSRRDRSGAPCIRRLCALTATAAPANAAGGGGWAQKPARPRRGSAAPPPVPSRAVPRVAVGGRRALRQAPAIPLFRVGGGWLLRPHSAAAAPRARSCCGQLR